MADIIDLIVADHARIRKLLVEVENALERSDGAGIPDGMAGSWELLAPLLQMHVDVAEEIGFPALFGRADSQARESAKATHDDIREAVLETRLYPPGSRPWQLAILAACAAARDHINDLESGALARFRRAASVPTREALGRHWAAFVAASVPSGLCDDPILIESPGCRATGGNVQQRG